MVKESEVVRSPKREAMGVILLALCLLSFLCIFSFNAEDIGELHYPPASPPHNLVGPLGAWCAYYIAFLPFGVSGYLLPFILLTGGLMMTLRSFVRIWPIWIWLTVGFVSFASFMEYQPAWWNGFRENLNVGSPGGTVGQLLAVRTLGRLINHTGAGIIFFTMFCLSILQLTGMHPFTPFIFLWDRIKYLYSRQKRIKPAESKLKLARKENPAKTLSKTESPDLEMEPVSAQIEFIATPEVITKQEPKLVPRTAPLKPESPKAEPMKVEPPKPVKPKVVSAPEADELSNVSINIAPGHDESGYQLPPLTLLDELPPLSARISTENTEEKARILQATLEQFGVEGTITHIETGPTVTSYEITPAAGVRVEKITALERNIALALHAQSIRIQAPIPGKGAVGIEIPNTKGTAVYFRELAESSAFHNPEIALPLALGKDVSGRIVVGDLASMPHLLIAGATGAGKTVCMNSLLTGLLISRSPDQLRLILVDPKTFEFQAYENLKHLVVPIITDPKKVTLGLRWAIKEMEKRYALFKKAKVRDIKGFNTRPIEKQADLFSAINEDEGEDDLPTKDLLPAKLPYIVIVVDELAELMSQAQQEIEPCIVRLAQLSRAAGIHMILATQRPSVNVITGTIKANIPGRIAFQVAQGNDSRTILDTIGAEKLLGKGDMLYLPPGKSKPVRLQGTWTSDAEMHRTTDFIRKQGSPEFISEIKQKIENTRPELPDMDDSDDLLESAIEVIRSTKRASTSSLQRRLKIGYNRAASLMDVLEEKGIIGPPTETGPRDILIDLDGDIPENTSSEPRPVEEKPKKEADDDWVSLDEESEDP